MQAIVEDILERADRAEAAGTPQAGRAAVALRELAAFVGARNGELEPWVREALLVHANGLAELFGTEPLGPRAREVLELRVDEPGRPTAELIALVEQLAGAAVRDSYDLALLAGAEALLPGRGVDDLAQMFDLHPWEIAAAAPASAASCGRIATPFPDTRYSDVSITKVTAKGVSCRTARRVARRAQLKALGMTPTSAIRTFRYDGYRVRGDLRPESDRYTARKGKRVVRWRF